MENAKTTNAVTLLQTIRRHLANQPTEQS